MSECNIPFFHSSIYKRKINKVILPKNLQGVQQIEHTEEGKKPVFYINTLSTETSELLSRSCSKWQSQDSTRYLILEPFLLTTPCLSLPCAFTSRILRFGTAHWPQMTLASNWFAPTTQLVEEEPENRVSALQHTFLPGSYPILKERCSSWTTTREILACPGWVGTRVFAQAATS